MLVSISFLVLVTRSLLQGGKIGGIEAARGVCLRDLTANELPNGPKTPNGELRRVAPTKK